MWREKSGDAEALLRRDVRDSLPLRHQLRLYLDPSALFKDASSGPAVARQHARGYNRARRWMLLPYIKRWIVIAVLLFVGIAPAEALGADESAYILVAAVFAVASCLAVAVSVYTAAGYLLLGMRDERRSG